MEKEIVVFKGNDVEVDSDGVSEAAKTVGKSFSLIEFSNLLVAFDTAIDKMEAISNRHQVRGAESEAAAADMANQSKKIANAIDAARSEAKRPYFDFGKKIDDLCKKRSNRLESIRDSLSKKVADHRREVRLAAEKAYQEAEEAKRKLEEDARKGKKITNKPVVFVPPPPPAVDPLAKISTGSGSGTVDLVPVFSAADLSKVDPRYLLLNEKALDAAWKAGIRQFDGVTVDLKEKVTFRTR